MSTVKVCFSLALGWIAGLYAGNNIEQVIDLPTLFLLFALTFVGLGITCAFFQVLAHVWDLARFIWRHIWWPE